MNWSENAKFTDLVGKVLTAVTVNTNEDTITFICGDGTCYMQYQHDDSYADVSIESIIGDLDDLLLVPILVAEERSCGNEHMDIGSAILTNIKFPAGGPMPDSFTWTFYTLRTIKGSVDIRWFGSSNGYYSEAVDFARFSS